MGGVAVLFKEGGWLLAAGGDPRKHVAQVFVLHPAASRLFRSVLAAVCATVGLDMPGWFTPRRKCDANLAAAPTLRTVASEFNHHA